MRKPNLARLLARRPDGIFAAPYEQGEIGPDLFEAACNMGLGAWCRSVRIALSGRTVEGLDQDQEPQASRLSAGVPATCGGTSHAQKNNPPGLLVRV
jgi:hypothetical protein